MHGGADGTPVGVSAGNAIYSQIQVQKYKNIGRYVLRTSAATRLPDLEVSYIIVHNKEGNSTVWWGGYGVDTPAVGLGLPIYEERKGQYPAQTQTRFH